MTSPLHALTEDQLHRVIYSSWDFQQALSALTFLVDECDFDETYTRPQLRKFRCYETSAIISFARPFENARGRDTLGLRALGVELSAGERLLKDRLLSLRRKVIAYSDDEFMHFKGSVVQPIEDSPLVMPAIFFQESLHLDQEEVQAFIALLTKFVRAISTKLFELAQVQPERLDIYKSPGQPASQ